MKERSDIEPNESHTSVCDSLSLEPIHHHEIYAGKRVQRGKFLSATKNIINSDVNGAINIMRKYCNNKSNEIQLNFKKLLQKNLKKILNPMKIMYNGKIRQNLSSFGAQIQKTMRLCK